MRKSVVIFLLNSKREVLLQLRDNLPNIDHPGRWGLIGGRIEKKESPLQAIKREIIEELGINCEVKELKCIEEMKLLKKGPLLKDTLLFIFKGIIFSSLEQINLNEGQRVNFFKLDEMPESNTIDFVKEFVLKNKERIFS